MNEFKYTVSKIPGGICCSAPGFGEMSLELETEKPMERDLDLLNGFVSRATVTGARNLVLERIRLLNGTVPVLLCYPKTAVKLPLVFFVHGFNNTFKEHVMRQGILLAQAGFFVVLPDARMHGERRPEEFEKIVSGSMDVVYRDIFKGTVEEISAIIDYFGQDPRVDAERVGMAGVSFGGMLTFFAATVEKRIRAAVPLISSPAWTPPDELAATYILNQETQNLIAEYEPVSHPERYFPTALLMQNGTRDYGIPLQAVHKLLEKLTPFYADTPERLKLVEYPVGHEVTPEMEEMMVKWFRKFL